MESGIGAVFGPSHLESSNIVQSLCETMEVPRIEASWENTPVENFNYYFNPYPEPTLLAKVITTIRAYFIYLLNTICFCLKFLNFLDFERNEENIEFTT
jgi:hypothetical protein